jgi:sensor histidine kinase YesM
MSAFNDYLVWRRKRDKLKLELCELDKKKPKGLGLFERYEKMYMETRDEIYDFTFEQEIDDTNRDRSVEITVPKIKKVRRNIVDIIARAYIYLYDEERELFWHFAKEFYKSKKEFGEKLPPNKELYAAIQREFDYHKKEGREV